MSDRAAPEMPESSLLRQLLDRQEIMAVMAAYARCADLNRDDSRLLPLGRA